jgi:hypothetical protein
MFAKHVINRESAKNTPPLIEKLEKIDTHEKWKKWYNEVF